MTSEEMNTLRVFERKIVRNVCGPVQEEDSWRIKTNKRYSVY
jgi:ribosomal protein S28E/S33